MAGNGLAAAMIEAGFADDLDDVAGLLASATDAELAETRHGLDVVAAAFG
jgi:hypothetical protein